MNSLSHCAAESFAPRFAPLANRAAAWDGGPVASIREAKLAAGGLDLNAFLDGHVTRRVFSFRYRDGNFEKAV